MTVHDAMVKITANCNNVLVFFQEVALKAPQEMAAPLLLRADKRSQNWFRKWAALHIRPHPSPHKNAPQDHSSLTGVLSEVAMYLQNEESLHHDVVAHHKEYR